MATITTLSKQFNINTGPAGSRHCGHLGHDGPCGYGPKSKTARINCCLVGGEWFYPVFSNRLGMTIGQEPEHSLSIEIRYLIS